MLSRVADSIYWMSRYIERAENVARFVEVNLHLSLDMPLGISQQWMPLVTTTGDQEQYRKRYTEDDPAHVMHFLTFDRENSNSILSCLHAARENARCVRESISADMWEHINQFYLMVRSAAAGAATPMDQPHAFYQRVRMNSHLFAGLTDSTMSRGEGWHFSRLGRLLERADKTSRILDVKYFLLLPTAQDVGTTLDDIQWVALLRSTSAFEMYRQRYGRTSPAHMIQFLVLDNQFPRAILYCVTKANDSLHAITGVPTDTFSNPAEQRLGQLRGELAYTHAQEIIKIGLHEFIDNLQTSMNQVGAAVVETFFALPPVDEPAHQATASE